tara:strand:+ start:356 stop:610 length:255 start_codon:yes stop_codon:yes gene_type:complete|mmetsp:Transcript_135/g.424  ORF Transcript_135/g.424 Transcript_135/m.424 type:complete len:85 (+) Transcript_135:303-557(+)
MCSHASKVSSRKEETRRHQKSEEEEEEEERTGTGGGMNLNPSTSMVGDADGGCGCAGVIEDGGEPGDPMSFLDDPFPAVNATAQ